MQESDNTENIIDGILLLLREQDSIFQHLSRDLIKQIFIDMFPLDSTRLNDIHLIEKIIRDIFKSMSILILIKILAILLILLILLIL